MLVNVGHPERSDELERMLSATLGTSRGGRARPQPGRQLDPAGERRAGVGHELLRALPTLPADLRPVALATAERLAPALAAGRLHRRPRARRVADRRLDRAKSRRAASAQRGAQASQRSSGSVAPAAASSAGSARGRRGERRDLDVAESRDRRAVVVPPSRSAAAGHGVSTTPATPQPGGARGLERQQRVVDRAEPGAGGDHERQPERRAARSRTR